MVKDVETTIKNCFDDSKNIGLVYEYNQLKVKILGTEDDFFQYPCDDTLDLAKNDKFDLKFKVDSMEFQVTKDQFINQNEKFVNFNLNYQILAQNASLEYKINKY